jgi:hypothetical protein
MKSLLAMCLLVAVTSVWAAPVSNTPTNVVKGQVLEVKDAGSYTYLRLKTKDGETWAAINKSPVKTGADVTLENVMVMTNFESKSLKRTFPTILFANLGGGAAPVVGGADMGKAHAGMAKPADIGDVRVAKASGPNARTVEEIITKVASLKDKPVVVSGKIVKYNPGIMGKNWIHLRDGSGSASAGSNDILVTTTSEAKLGDVVTVQGNVRTDKDFGAGYAYKVLIEDATFKH